MISVNNFLEGVEIRMRANKTNISKIKMNKFSD